MTRPALILVALLVGGDFASAGDPKLPAGLDVASINALARSIVVESVPERIEEKRDWGKQSNRKELKFRGQGFKTRLTTADRAVNHGLWKQYRIEPVDPKNKLALGLEDLRTLPDGGFAFDLRITAPVTASATVQQWVWGVRMIAATVDADATATATLSCEVRTSVEPGTLLPTIRLAPTVVASTVDLDEFRLRKLGELPRSVANELSDEAKKIVLRYLRKYEGKIAAKANAALEKRSKAGKLAFSPLPFLQ